MHEIKVDLKNFKFTDTKVLMLSDDINGKTVAHLLAQHGHIFTDPEILRLAEHTGYTVAHEMARAGHIFTDPEILRLGTFAGWSVAHVQADNEWTTEDSELLTLVNATGWTVAHAQARRGWITKKTKLLALTDLTGYTVDDIIHMDRDPYYIPVFKRPTAGSSLQGIQAIEHDEGDVVFNSQMLDVTKIDKECKEAKDQTQKEYLKAPSTSMDNGNTRAHELAWKGTVFTDPEILTLRNNDGWTVAHSMADIGYVFTDIPTLSLEDDEGDLVASIQVEHGWVPGEDRIARLISGDVDRRVAELQVYHNPAVRNILLIKNSYNTTIAHAMAYYKWTTEDPELLALVDDEGDTVAHIQATWGWTTVNPEILGLRNMRGETVWDAMCQYNLKRYTDTLKTLPPPPKDNQHD